MKFFTEIAILSALVGVGVEGHARITSPIPRLTGSVHLAACGAAVTSTLESDKHGPIENAMAVKDSSYKCNAYLCRGYQYADNKSNVKKVKVGDVIAFHIDLVASHKPGYYNMSVVNTATNTVVKALKTVAHWPDVTDGSTFDQKTNFNITIPTGLESACGTAGKCVMQWYWYSIGNKQTYESCHDFYVGT